MEFPTVVVSLKSLYMVRVDESKIYPGGAVIKSPEFAVRFNTPKLRPKLSRRIESGPVLVTGRPVLGLKTNVTGYEVESTTVAPIGLEI
jgi:hypothetical protein